MLASKSPLKLLVIVISCLFLFDVLFIGALYAYLIQAPKPQPTTTGLQNVNSCNELSSIFKEYKDSNKYGTVFDSIMNFGGIQKSTTTNPTVPSGSTAQPEYSKTNVQVAGVDEADIVKSDGQYIYVLSPSKRTVSIVEAYPPTTGKKVAEITFISDESPSEMFLYQNTLAVMGQSYTRLNTKGESTSSVDTSVYPDMYYYSGYTTFFKIYSVKNHSNPTLTKDLKFQGNYQTSRLIEDKAYLVVNDYKYYSDTFKDDPELLLPMYSDGNSVKTLCNCADIKSAVPFEYPNYLNIISISLADNGKTMDKEVILGGSDNVYASQSNLYIANTTYNNSSDILRGIFDYIMPTEEKTFVYKFSLNKGKIDFSGKTEVKGWVLNQFSMDEYDTYFRIATTQGHVSQMGATSGSRNNIYVLDSKLNQVGAIENIAPGEQIYSARFMGKKGYLVTFQKVDPFFTIDLSNPKAPKVLGALKIPGYSDYLHPIDENHILGLGKNAVSSTSGNFSWYQGIKMAIFDVTDFDNPKQEFVTEIGDRGTDSYALHDHKAFLFDQEKELLVIPVMLAELTPEQKTQSGEANAYGTYTYQGAYVYKVNLTTGFTLKGRITHYDDTFNQNYGYGYYGDTKSVQRAMYIEDYLYTISGEKVKINKLSDLKDVKDISL